MSEQTPDLETLGWDDIPTTRPHIPGGNYTFRLMDVKLQEKNDKSGYYIGYTALIQSGEHAGFRVPFNILSLNPEQLWQFKRTVKALKLKLPKVATALDAAREAVPLMNGLVVEGKISKQAAQTKNAEGKWIDNPEEGFKNSVREITKLASGL